MPEDTLEMLDKVQKLSKIQDRIHILMFNCLKHSQPYTVDISWNSHKFNIPLGSLCIDHRWRSHYQNILLSYYNHKMYRLKA
jgi:hypothetical protein